jgi:hypothetical protein
MKTFKEYIREQFDGLAKDKTLEDFYHKFDSKGYYDIKDFEQRFNELLDQGAKVELEHTKDMELAKKIAKDHLWEDLEYYNKLKKIEH